MMNFFSFICYRDFFGDLVLLNRYKIDSTGFLQVCVLIIGMIVVYGFVGKANFVPTMSMMPTIDEGDVVYVNKFVYVFDSPERGDIVTFDKDKYLVKRVVGMPGDKIFVKNGLVFINGKQLPVVRTSSLKLENGGFDSLTKRATPIPLTETTPDGRSYSIFYSTEAKGEKGTEAYNNNVMRINYLANFKEITIPENKYFVMGDNRMFSADSRVFGLVDESEIVGRVSTILFNLNAFAEIFIATFTDVPTDNLFLLKDVTAN